MRRYLTALLALLVGPALAGCADRLSPDDRLKTHLDALEREGQGPVQFVLERLDEHDLLLFDDALHTAAEPFEFYRALVRTPEFQQKVKYIFLEAVPISQQAALDAYFATEPEDLGRLYPAFQNDFSGEGWSYQTYFDLMHDIYEVNRSLPERDRFAVVGVNAASYWPAIEVAGDVDRFRQTLVGADYTQYRTILGRLDGFESGDRGIYLTNTRHAYKNIRDSEGRPFLNAGTFFHLRHPGRSYSIRFHSVILNIEQEVEPGSDDRQTAEGMERVQYSWGRVADGLWDAAFAANGNEPVAFQLKRNVFGEAPYEGNHMLFAAPGQTMLDANDAVIFLAPLEELHKSAIHGELYSPGFKAELARRLPLLYTPEQLQAQFVELGVTNLTAYIDAAYRSAPAEPLPQASAAEPIDTWRHSGEPNLSAPIPTAAQSSSHAFEIEAEGVPSAVVEAIRADLDWAEERIGEKFGRFPGTATVRIYPHREEFTQALREAWGIPETACWMVGAADDHSLYLLSPGVWEAEACEHDPDDELHRRMLVAHEAVHVYHGQDNPSEDIGLLEEIGWFSEGLATYVSGQLETSHAGRAAEAVSSGEVPGRLMDAWSGPYRYGVAGSMVEFIDAHWGRDTLTAALEVTTQDELLSLLETTESGFLADWESWVREASDGAS
jgi:hypothetical protein